MHTNDEFNMPDDQGRVVINIGHPTNEPDLYLAPQIARIIKPHQIGGVRFLYDNLVESIERFNTSTGFGCILAHSMGLGKTLQVVCFCDVFLRHTPAKTILCIMPINTLQNWLAEFNMWLPAEGSSSISTLASHGEVRCRTFNLHVLNDSHKTLAARAKVIREWNMNGGVLLIGYEQYRLLSLRRHPRSRKKDVQKIAAEDEKSKVLFDGEFLGFFGFVIVENYVFDGSLVVFFLPCLCFCLDTPSYIRFSRPLSFTTSPFPVDNHIPARLISLGPGRRVQPIKGCSSNKV